MKESQKSYEGFLNNSTFQVRCHGNLTMESDSQEIRNSLLDSCKKYLVITLAKFKIAYDYNTSKTKIFATPRVENFEGSLGYRIKVPGTIITEVQQIELSLTESQIMQLITLYDKFLPGKISQEWNDGEYIYIIYVITRDNLINQVKNIDLPFGIEY